MAFRAAQVAFLQRLVSERPALRSGGGIALMFSEHYSLGKPVGNRVEYTDVHFESAERLLRAHDLPVTALARDATRADASAYGGMSEKSFSTAPHADSVAVKGLGRCTLDGHELYTPDGAHVVLTAEQAGRVVCQRLMVVENLETFRKLGVYSWIERGRYDVLAIYRGDRALPNKDAAAVIQVRLEPIWAFFDFDPAGLGLANSMPPQRLERVILPPAKWLEQAANTAWGRQLFDSHLVQYERTLDSATHPEVVAAWALMKRLRSAVAQERMVRVD